MLLEGTRLLHHDPYLGGLTARTLRLAFEATAIAVVLGLPAACAIGIGRSHRSGWGLVVANAGLGLPPVAIGVYLYLLLIGHSTPWGGTWLDSMNGMVLGQTILALPIVIAVSAIAIRGLPDALVAQARAFGASGWRLGLFTLREAKVGVLTAVVFALGSAFAEVGAVTLIGGNSVNATATLASQVINDAHESDVPAAVEHTIVLMALVIALGVVLTVVQHWRPGAVRRRLRSASRSPA
jgi:tungstate transport system permease protein